MKNKILLMCLLLILVGCGGSSGNDKKVVGDSISEGEYRIMDPFLPSDTRQAHAEFNRGSTDVDAVGQGLMQYAKEYFSPDSYYLQEGKILGRDELQKTSEEDTEGLLAFKAKDNVHGLNPEEGSSIPINNSESIVADKTTIPVVDIFELDFYQSTEKNAKLDGLAIALVLNPNIKAGGQEVKMKNAQLKAYGSESARQLVAYLRTLPEVGNKTPIYISLFNASSTDSSLPGTFIADGYGNDGINSFRDINEQWVVFPSEEASRLDTVSTSQFESMREKLYLFLPTDIAVTAQGKFVNDKLSVLKITINTQTKTYTEKQALMQKAKESLRDIEVSDIEVSVRVNSNLEAFGIIKKDKNSSEPRIELY